MDHRGRRSSSRTPAANAYVTSLLGAAFFTLREAVLGFFLGAGFGLGLAIVLIHVRVLERGLVPLLVASQTIPIIAIAPLIVVGLKAGWFGVAIVATYLTFFPVTIAALRGMRSADPRAFELMRSYAADRRTVLGEAAAAGQPAVPLHGLQDRRHGQRRRAPSSASSRPASARASAARSSRRCSTTASRRATSGSPSPCARVLGIGGLPGSS